MSEPQTYGEHFASGVANGRGEVIPSLQADAARFQSMVPEHYLPRSVLAQLRPSMNGYSDRSYERVLPDGRELSSGNGSSENTQQGDNDMIFAGAKEL